jgi:RNA polymerase sigma factor (sigma-70 family)
VTGDVVPLDVQHRLDQQRRQELVFAARPMVLRIVAQRCALWPGQIRASNFEHEDLVEIGELELSHVVKKFDIDGDTPFEGYAWVAVDGAIKTAIKNESLYQKAVRKGMYRGADGERRDRERRGETSADARQAAVEAFSDAVVAGMLASLAAADPEARVMARELHDKIRQVISELSAKDGRLIHLHYFDDRTLDETAVDLGISRSTVKRRHHNILARLGARLLALGVDGAPR